MTWRSTYFDLRTGLFVPQLVVWDPETREFTSVEESKGFATWQEAEETVSVSTGPEVEGLGKERA